MAALLGSQPKPLASLSSGLLARKGQARPAMRPQGFGFTSLSHAGDQLGWNDMGHDVASPEPVEALPPVLVEREALKEEFTAPVVEPVVVEAPTVPVFDAAVRPVSVLTAKRLQRETRAKVKDAGKAAFTLRLDADRHLRLRLATATRHRSAQQLVTEALDAFLKTLPEVEALASQLPPVGRRSTGE
ncbi:conserved hypothetical protein [Sphingomonas sp. EC-HK361]|uniref:hypothetical protein n=1 Tax=Sphingomonas sp. EC-HK361 TaxID=2038397 RepID=UPI0012545B53|nr:hypothetical protein [Sphingomonas sp. EC-HK361]VVT11599.1 conserved hypothetical protein [Sphingomonas sp. EC-HK361]